MHDLKNAAAASHYGERITKSKQGGKKLTVTALLTKSAKTKAQM